MSDLQETLGEVIRRERRERQLTREDLAQRAAVSVVYLGEVERGQKYPSARVLEQLAAALDLEVPDLLDRVATALRGEQEPLLLAPVGFTRPQSPHTPRGPTMLFGGFFGSRPPLVVVGHDDVPSPRPLRLVR